MKIAFIGGGNMAEAIISALLSSKLAVPQDLAVSDVSQARLDYLRQKFGMAVAAENRQVITGKEIVILAVKPQVLAEVMSDLRGLVKPTQLVISIIAGKRMDTIEKGLDHDCLVRSMPNTPAQIGEGMTAWTATKKVSESQKKQAAAILGAMGLELFVEEEKFLDMATAVSGSGPAYVFLFVESLVNAAQSIGFTAEVSQKLVMQTLLGSAHLLQKSRLSPQELRRMVTSPGGTTAEAISSFEGAGFQDIMTKAVRAAYEKAQKLGG
jgi:pyrroline-5-carboxylate reductase